MLCCDIQGYFGKIQVRTDAAGGRKAGGVTDVLKDAKGKFPGCKAVHR